MAEYTQAEDAANDISITLPYEKLEEMLTSALIA
jgi:hypothetical protein